NALARLAYSELFGTNISASVGGRTLRNGQFKLIQFNDGHEEFYDLAADPYEAANLLASTLTVTQQANYYSLTLKLAGYQTALAQPLITSSAYTNAQFALTVQRATNLACTLWRAAVLDDLAWSP